MIYAVINDFTGEEAYRYEADAPIEWVDYPFDSFSHIAQPAPDAPPVAIFPEEWRVYVAASFVVPSPSCGTPQVAGASRPRRLLASPYAPWST